MARGRKPDQAWLLINKVLCGDDIKSYYYVKAHIIQDPEPEQETASVADEEGEKQIRETSEYLARKQVWDVSVIDISDTIRVLFSVDGGVCVRGFDFKFWNDSWWVVANELACD